MKLLSKNRIQQKLVERKATYPKAQQVGPEVRQDVFDFNPWRHRISNLLSRPEYSSVSDLESFQKFGVPKTTIVVKSPMTIHSSPPTTSLGMHTTGNPPMVPISARELPRRLSFPSRPPASTSNITNNSPRVPLTARGLVSARGTANVRDASAPAGGARRVPAGTAVRGVGTSAHRAHSANSTAGGTRMNMNAMRDRIRALAVSKK